MPGAEQVLWLGFRWPVPASCDGGDTHDWISMWRARANCLQGGEGGFKRAQFAGPEWHSDRRFDLHGSCLFSASAAPVFAAAYRGQILRVSRHRVARRRVFAPGTGQTNCRSSVGLVATRDMVGMP